MIRFKPIPYFVNYSFLTVLFFPFSLQNCSSVTLKFLHQYLQPPAHLSFYQEFVFPPGEKAVFLF